MHYSGIGSRKTPTVMLKNMRMIAQLLAKKDYILRSGGADGADSAFEQGCDKGGGMKEIYLPWEKFQGNPSPLFPPTADAIQLAGSVHPVYDTLSTKARLLVARNMHQVLGKSLREPVDFVLCWTEDGAEDESHYSRNTGGTGSAISLASRHGIPVYNLSNNASYSYVVNVLLSV